VSDILAGLARLLKLLGQNKSMDLVSAFGGFIPVTVRIVLQSFNPLSPFNMMIHSDEKSSNLSCLVCLEFLVFFYIKSLSANLRGLQGHFY